MDKVKQILELVRKHHFWILCGLAALVGLVAWYLSTATLADQFRTDSDKINKYITDLKGIPPEPKEEWATGAEGHIKTVKDDVKNAWDKLYQAQKQNVFVWPQGLGPDFLKAVENIDGTTNDLDLPLRERYGDQVRNAVAQLAKIVDAEPPAAAIPTVTTDPAVIVEHQVFWPQINDIQQGFEWDRPPSTQIVKQAQEELWVYKALCDIIAKVNNGAHGHHDAPIKDIVSMEIAYAISDAPANGGHGRVPPISNLAGPAAPDAAGSPPPDAGTPVVKPDVKSRLKGDALAPVGADGTTPIDPEIMWKSFRYLKETGEPMMAADVDSAASNAKFFLMPFKLVVRIDRRNIDRLLVEFRNSPLPMEVKQVRLNAQSIGSGGVIMSGGGGGGGGDHGGRSGSDERGSRGGGYIADPGKGYDRNSILEVQGVVYLIKPPILDAAAPGDSGQPGSAEGTETPVVTPPATGEAASANKQLR